MAVSRSPTRHRRQQQRQSKCGSGTLFKFVAASFAASIVVVFGALWHSADEMVQRQFSFLDRINDNAASWSIYPSSTTLSSSGDGSKIRVSRKLEDTRRRAILSSINDDHIQGNKKIKNNTFQKNNGCALQAFDLSVQHLSVIPFDEDVTPFWDDNDDDDRSPATQEDFLPVVAVSSTISTATTTTTNSFSDTMELRFRLRPVTSAPYQATQDITAYRIVAVNAHGDDDNINNSHNSNILWDSGKVQVETMPRSIPWGSAGSSRILKVGTIVKWHVQVWDASGAGPSSPSAWAKFAVGPSSNEEHNKAREDEKWRGQWITHPTDYMSLIQQGERKLSRGANVSPEYCDAWKRRRPLPVARASFLLPPAQSSSSSSQQSSSPSKLLSALLVVSGLGSFSVTLDGKTLSTSSVQDPPLTDYSQRVSYRGYDVTRYLLAGSPTSGEHVVAITLGSGWWDSLPLNGKIVFQDLMPKGPLTVIAELHLTYADGRHLVEIPTTGGSATSTTTIASNKQPGQYSWQMGKGHIVESNVYTGETIDLARLLHNRGWDMPSSSSSTSKSNNLAFAINWVEPVLYKEGISVQEWHQKLQNFAYNHIVSRASNVAPIGSLVPIQIPPVMPIERILPKSISDLGQGRWLIDFGKAFSGVLRFEEGLSQPIVPEGGVYPRNHIVTDQGDNVSFVTVVYGDSLEMTTGDINLVLVAGYGYHNGGHRRKAGLEDPDQAGGPCWPRDHAKILTQRDVYLAPPGATQEEKQSYFAQARQARFTFHGFRYAEVCCTKEAPQSVSAIKYRTAFREWGEFESSNVVLNGAYELTRNAFDSNMISIQSDCPHREKLQYGGDMIANSPAALHLYDVSAFYSKIIQDWTESQWDNGAYTTTSVFMDILRDMAIGQMGSGETVWASLAPVLTARHLQNYGDHNLVERTFSNHVQWMNFLNEHWLAGMNRKYPDMANYKGGGSGLGDWLGLEARDNWLTHHAFYLASVRAVVYLANKLGKLKPQQDETMEQVKQNALTKSRELEDTIRSVYKAPVFSYHGHNIRSLGQNLGLFARLVPQNDRCATLRSWLASAGVGHGQIWPGDEEQLFYKQMNDEDFAELLQADIVMGNRNDKVMTKWKLFESVNGGILDIKYTFKTLSDMGFHDLALNKASGKQFPGYGYMMSFNATTMWETWWRSEDLFSRNHPMFGAIAEWLASSAAGVSLHPTTIGGQELVFWPRIPTSRLVLNSASTIQGTKRGDAAIAWKFDDHGASNSSSVTVQIRILVPPSSKATLKLPALATQDSAVVKVATVFPDLNEAKQHSDLKCAERRKNGAFGFPYFWHFDKSQDLWFKVKQPQTIGTPCTSFLWEIDPPIWIDYPDYKPIAANEGLAQSALQPGLYEIQISNWKLKDEVPVYTNYQGPMGPYCSAADDSEWNIDDAVHLM